MGALVKRIINQVFLVWVADIHGGALAFLPAAAAPDPWQRPGTPAGKPLPK